MRNIYSIAIWLYNAFIYCATLFSKKASLWVNGRKNIFNLLKKECAGKKIVWVHCASLGEYEQGKPLIEKIKKNNPSVAVLCTFFSPSGYEVKKNDPLPDIVSYLPIDRTAHVKKFLDMVNPVAAYFIKYEYWYNYMAQLALRKIPFFYVSAIYRKEQPFFKWYGNWFRKHLEKCSFFYVQDKNSLQLLKSIGIAQATIIGDTRFDRVFQTASQKISLDFAENFTKNKKTIVCGSTWREDEEIIQQLYARIYTNHKLIIAPHLIHNERIESIKKRFSSYKTICYSEREGKNLAEYDVLIIDTIGLLNKLYYYGTYAYIGGGFKTGLHNILEAVVFHIPIFFGPKYAKFNEAKELIDLQVAFSISNSNALYELISKLEKDSEQTNLIREKAKKYVESNLGAVEKIKLPDFSSEKQP